MSKICPICGDLFGDKEKSIEGVHTGLCLYLANTYSRFTKKGLELDEFVKSRLIKIYNKIK